MGAPGTSPRIIFWTISANGRLLTAQRIAPTGANARMSIGVRWIHAPRSAAPPDAAADSSASRGQGCIAMIMRVWHGYTSPENAEAYEHLLKRDILPGIHRVRGYGGAWLLRRNKATEAEFIAITAWESWE